MKIIGIDDSVVRIFTAKARSIFKKNVSFFKQDIFIADVSSADVVYIYLPRELMPALQKKLQTELKTGAIAISNKVFFPSWQPIEKLDDIFIYQA